MSRFLKEDLAGLEPYTPGEQPKDQKLIKLNTNESPFPPSPKVIQAIDSVQVEKLRLYPDPEAKELIRAAADFYGVRENQLMAGNGSDEILAFVFMAYGAKIYFPEISYGFYRVYGQLFGETARTIPLDKELRIRPADYFGLDGNMILANPNAPTGIALTREEVKAILNHNKERLVIIDEAYVDFGAESMVPLIDEYDNLLVTHTMSKSRSLAGARIGLAIGSEELIQDLNRIKYSFNPYNLNRLSILAGTASFQDKEYFESCCHRIMEIRENFVLEMEQWGFEVLPSKANFVFAKPPGMPGKEYYQKLRENGILVRHFSNPLIEDYVRITVGEESEMKAILRLHEATGWFCKEER